MAIFDERDEVDIAMVCCDDPIFSKELDKLEDDYNNTCERTGEIFESLIDLEDILDDDSPVDCSEIIPDEADASAIGSDSEDIIDADQSLLTGVDDSDGEMIDMINSGE